MKQTYLWTATTKLGVETICGIAIRSTFADVLDYLTAEHVVLKAASPPCDCLVFGVTVELRSDNLCITKWLLPESSSTCIRALGTHSDSIHTNELLLISIKVIEAKD